MRNLGQLSLSQTEKKLLVLLVVGTLIMLCITTYISVNKKQEERPLLNSNLHVIDTTGTPLEYFGLDDMNATTKHKITNYDVVSYNPPINSTEISAKHWNKIARDIKKIYDKYDSFVVICGSDTLTYTASALSFILENLHKPVLVTCNKDVIPSLILASSTKIPEVMIPSVSHNQHKLLRACRAVQHSVKHFTTPNNSELYTTNCLKTPDESLTLRKFNPKIKVVVVKLSPGVPGTTEKYLETILNTDISGIVFEVYENGNTPLNPKFLDIISALTKKGVVSVFVSQSDNVRYMDNIKLIEAGVLNGGDMTTSAAFAKLTYLLSNVSDKKIAGLLMDRSFRGEMTEENEENQETQPDQETQVL